MRRKHAEIFILTCILLCLNVASVFSETATSPMPFPLPQNDPNYQPETPFVRPWESPTGSRGLSIASLKTTSQEPRLHLVMDFHANPVLPTAMGWGYECIYTSLPENRVFSIVASQSRNILVQNSIATGMSAIRNSGRFPTPTARNGPSTIREKSFA